MTKKTADEPTTDAAAPADAARLERRVARERLIREITMLQAQRESLNEALEERSRRLESLMTPDSLRKCTTEYGDAEFTEPRTFAVHDVARLATLFDRRVLAEHFKVTAAFYDAAKKSGIAIEEAVTVAPVLKFSVSAPRSAKARALRAAFIAESRKTIEQKIDAIAASMQGKPKK